MMAKVVRSFETSERTTTRYRNTKDYLFIVSDLEITVYQNLFLSPENLWQYIVVEKYFTGQRDCGSILHAPRERNICVKELALDCWFNERFSATCNAIFPYHL